MSLRATGVEVLQRMVQALPRDASAVDGEYACNDLGFRLAWSVRQGSFSDCLPAWNEKKDCVLFFLGEHFGDKDDIVELKSKKHQVRKADASYLIHLYEEKGEAFLEELNGGFCGALLDLKARRGMLFGDRFGLERIHYREDKGALYFASDARVLLRVSESPGSVDEASLAEWFRYGCVLGERTLFEGIYRLSPGTALEFQGAGTWRKRVYFSPDLWEDQTFLGFDYFATRAKETLSKVFARYVKAPEGISFCPGGVGGRLILALAEVPYGKLPFVSFAGDADADVEPQHLASQFGQAHHREDPATGFIDGFPRYAEQAVHLSDGLVDITGALTLHRATWARGIAPVFLTGGLWWEIFVDQGFILTEAPCNSLSSEMEPAYSTAGERLREVSLGHPLSFKLFHVLSNGCHGHLKVTRSQLAFRTPYFDRDLTSLLYRIPSGTHCAVRAVMEVLADTQEDRPSVSTKRSWLSRMLRSAVTPRCSTCLVGGDVELGLDAIMRLRGKEKWQLARPFDSRQATFCRLFRTDLSSYIKEVLLDSHTLNRIHFAHRIVEQTVNEHITGARDHTTAISRMLSMEITLRTIVESKASTRPVTACA